jgi:hypothetical protein
MYMYNEALSLLAQVRDIDIYVANLDTSIASVGGMCTGSKEVVDNQVRPTQARSLTDVCFRDSQDLVMSFLLLLLPILVQLQSKL